MEKLAEDNELSQIHDPKLPYSFNSGKWKREYNPDIIFVSKNIQQAIKSVKKPIPHSQHRPISCEVLARIRPLKVPFKRRFNFTKVNWPAFSRDLDSKLKLIPASHTQYYSFIEIVEKVSRNHIPRGCRINYIPGLSPENSEDYETYTELFNINPFSVETSEKGERLMEIIAETKRTLWHSLLNKMDMKHRSKKTWVLIKRLDGDPTKSHNTRTVTANEVAHQLLLNGKTNKENSKG